MVHSVSGVRLASMRLGELLLDEERAQMGELPGTGDAENHHLDEHPADDSAVCRLGLISELGLSLLQQNKHDVRKDVLFAASSSCL
jgi:hypothetical protein